MILSILQDGKKNLSSMNLIHKASFPFPALKVQPSTQILNNWHIWDIIHELLINHVHLNLLNQV